MLSIFIISNFQHVIIFSVVWVKRHYLSKPNITFFLHLILFHEEQSFQVHSKSMLLHVKIKIKTRKEYFPEYENIKQGMNISLMIMLWRAGKRVFIKNTITHSKIPIPLCFIPFFFLADNSSLVFLPCSSSTKTLKNIKGFSSLSLAQLNRHNHQQCLSIFPDHFSILFLQWINFCFLFSNLMARDSAFRMKEYIWQ